MYIGVDLGGTNTAAAIVDENGEIQQRVSIPTIANAGPDAVVSGVVKACDWLIAETGTRPASIGVGVPGTVRDDIGLAVFTPNLPLRNVYMADKLSTIFGCPVRLGNDANFAAFGEVIAGVAKGAKDVVMITLGTGLGGGVIIRGKLYTGLTGAGGELGHMVIFAGGRKCGCGRLGCWEPYSSASGLITTTLEYMEDHPESLMWELCERKTEKLEGRSIFEAFRANDSAAILAVGKYIEHLAIGIANLINILEPELFCIGGGISNAWDCLEEPLSKAVKAENIVRFSEDVPKTKLVKAMLGNDAGIIGAAMMGREMTINN